LKKEKEIHNKIIDKFLRFQKIFDEEKEVLKHSEEENI
jgi:hypothetical protein